MKRADPAATIGKQFVASNCAGSYLIYSSLGFCRSQLGMLRSAGTAGPVRLLPAVPLFFV